MRNTNENFALHVERACSQFGERTALLYGEADESLSYAQLEHRVRAVAAVLLREGVAPDDCVALWLPNSPAYVIGFMAAAWLGATLAPLGVLLRPREIVDRLAVAGAKVLVTTPALAASLPDMAVRVLALDAAADVQASATVLSSPPRERAAEDVALLAFTSGTTGSPRAAEITHAGVAWNTAALAQGFVLGPSDVQMAVAPLSHVLGMQGVMNATLTTGGAIVLVERFDPQLVLRLMSRTETTGLMGAPSMFSTLVRAARQEGSPPRLRFAHGGGAPFPAELAATVAEVFGCVVREGYGMSEVGGGISHTPLDRAAKAHSVGRAFPGSKLRVVDRAARTLLPPGERGEVQVKSPSVMRAYRGDADATRAALDDEGWLATGDLGYLDEEGDLFLVGRNKDLIIRSGYNVFPREVEEVLAACPGVSEVAVLGIPDPERGEEIVALVVPSQPSLAPEEVKLFAKDRLAAYKYPRHVLLVDALPKSPTGKLLKREIDRETILARIKPGLA
jgi:long-chain acyl-CoA synthetase